MILENNFFCLGTLEKMISSSLKSNIFKNEGVKMT